MYTPPDCTMPKQQSRKSKKSSNGRRPVSLTTVPRPMIAPVTYMQLGYFSAVRITESASGVGNFNSFRLNDLYDPDFTGTGSQPVGFDQVSALYTRFRVLKVAVSIDWVKRGTTSSAYAVAYPSAQSTLPAGCQAWPLQPYAKSGAICLGGPSMFHTSMVCDLPKILGLTRAQYMDEIDFTCTNSSSPTRSPYLHVGVFSRFGTLVDCEVYVRFVYSVECSQPVNNDLS